MKAQWLLLVMASLAVGCGNSHGVDDLPGSDGGNGTDGATNADGGITLDLDGAIGPDGQIIINSDGGVGDGGFVMPDAPTAECGNGIIEIGESCDDRNSVDTDACGNDCQWNAYCGNGTTEGSEVCDDGNTFAGDGCSADCLSDESCGNGIRDIAVGELCDGETWCAGDCMSVVGCGNGTTESPELCDDDNTTRWDGCGSDCRPEISMIINTLEIGSTSDGCDYTGDGEADNAFARALGVLTAFVNPQLQMQVSSGNVLVLLTLLGLDDATVTNDSSLRVGWMQGVDADSNSSNNFSGSGEFLIAAGNLNTTTGNPNTSFFGSLSSRHLLAGPEDFQISLGFSFPFDLRRGRIDGTIASTSATSYRMDNALVCGVFSANTMAGLPNVVSSILGGSGQPSCDGGADSTLADLVIGGRSGFPAVTAQQPDVDVDGDGLERFVVQSTWSGSGNCQPVIVGCYDGDGTYTAGRDCVLDPTFADGVSMGLNATAVGAKIIGEDSGS